MKDLLQLFRPAINLMNRLKYPQKFTLISSIFLLPLSLVIYLLISEIQTRNDFAEKETFGNAYLRPLRQLWEDIPKSQLANNSPHNQTNQDLTQIQARIDRHLQTLETLDQEVGKALLTTDKLSSIKQAWQELQANKNATKEAQNRAYNSLRQQIYNFRVHIGDQSNLILDPDLDSYYLMDATLLKLPEMQHRLVEIQLLTQQAIINKQDTLETRVRLIELLGNLKHYNQELQKHIEDVFEFNKNPSLRSNLEPSLNNFVNSIDLLTQTVVDLTAKGNINNVRVFSIAAEENLNRSYQLWDKTIVELDTLLEKRIDGFVQRQILICIFVSIILGIVLYLYIAFYLGVKQTVSSLSIASQQMIEGRITDSLNLDNRDELAEVVKSFNNIALALIAANKEVNLLNQCLKDENVRMGAELEITSRLQQMILPKEQELAQIPDLEIAGFMLSASEVGGDYYDVIYHDGKVKIGIGDVTGHGLESGVLMIMVQTAVRTLLENNETDPKKFLDTLNRTIFHNVQRMNSDKNMTLCLLDYQDGKVRISGQHEEMLVVRRGGLIQRVDTVDLGLPIGLEKEISEFIGYADIQLYPNDVVVLYTDGVTEAENPEGELYGLKRLTQVIKDNWQNPADEIKQAIVDDLYKYMGQQKLLDDITIVVLKRKELEVSKEFIEAFIEKQVDGNELVELESTTV